MKCVGVLSLLLLLETHYGTVSLRFFKHNVFKHDMFGIQQVWFYYFGILFQPCLQTAW